jgi:hypothetical protein
MIKRISTAFLGAVVVIFLTYENVLAGVLFGRVINADGSPAAKQEMTVEGKTIRTNEFGGYEVELADGERQLAVTINNKHYTSETIAIYSPRTKQNWRIEAAQLKKIR